jgi:hypothetical protein
MPVEMLSRLGKALPRLTVGASLAGDGLQERLRSTTFALLGLITAVGLVLVGIAANQGWPDFVDSPIPEAPNVHVGEAGIAAGAAHRTLPRSRDQGSAASTISDRPDSRAHRSSRLGLSPQDQLPVSAPETQTPAPAPAGQGGGEAPGSPAVPSPAEPPVSAAPQPTEAVAPVPASPAVSEPASGNPGQGHGKAKGQEKSHGPPASTAPSAPAAPSAPPAPKAAPEEAPAAPGDGPGNGHGHAYGHDK